MAFAPTRINEESGLFKQTFCVLSLNEMRAKNRDCVPTTFSLQWKVCSTAAVQVPNLCRKDRVLVSQMPLAKFGIGSEGGIFSQAQAHRQSIFPRWDDNNKTQPR